MYGNIVDPFFVPHQRGGFGGKPCMCEVESQATVHKLAFREKGGEGGRKKTLGKQGEKKLFRPFSFLSFYEFFFMTISTSAAAASAAAAAVAAAAAAFASYASAAASSSSSRLKSPRSHPWRSPFWSSW